MLDHVENRGKLVHECTLTGETRADDVFPGHPNGIPVSRDRWLIVYATRGWRGVDDDRTIVYQIRKNAPDGDVLTDGLLRATDNAWDAFGDGSRFARNQGHPVAFGVPKGAMIDGTPAPNANVFAIKWRVTARDLSQSGGNFPRDRVADGRTQFVEWTQCRLNDAGDDIEILQPPTPLRQLGYDAWLPFCRHEGLSWMNQAFSQAVPLNDAATEWVDVNHFDGGRIAPMRYTFSTKTGLYEWTDVGELVSAPDQALSEASIARVGGGFVICARAKDAIAWLRTDDPFGKLPAPTFTADPAINCPVTLYACADGALRILTGDIATSPYGHGRCPLYLWEIDPETFASGEPAVIADPIAEGILPRDTGPRAEMCKLLPHMGGHAQTLVWRVRTKNVGRAYGSLPPVTPEQKEAHGLYHGALVYTEDYPPAWRFE